MAGTPWKIRAVQVAQFIVLLYIESDSANKMLVLLRRRTMCGEAVMSWCEDILVQTHERILSIQDSLGFVRYLFVDSQNSDVESVARRSK